MVPLEDQLTSWLDAATDGIRQRYAGEPVQEVAPQLVGETRLDPDIAAGWQPDHARLYAVVRAIVNGR